MRIKINFTKNTTPVGISNQSMVNGFIHKCLGENNEYHDKPSDYSISSLWGGKLNEDKKTLSFENGGFIIVSSIDEDFIDKLLMGVLSNGELFHGMKFCGVNIPNEKFLNGWNHFATLSPFIIKETLDKGKYRFVTLNEPDFSSRVKEYLLKKINKINPKLDLRDFDVSIPSNPSHKVKKILVKNVINYANQCQISIKCNKEVANLLFNIGIGQSTGSGFGTIYNTRNHGFYKVSG